MEEKIKPFTINIPGDGKILQSDIPFKINGTTRLEVTFVPPTMVTYTFDVTLTRWGKILHRLGWYKLKFAYIDKVKNPFRDYRLRRLGVPQEIIDELFY